MGKFQNFIENRHADMTSEARETVREINVVFNKAVDSNPKINGFGINDIDFEVINEEKTKSGIQVNLEVKGSAVARDDKHISRMLQKLCNATREQLWGKKIFIEMMYHEIHTSENVLEVDESTPVDRRFTLHFRLIAAAIIFSEA